MPRPPALFPAVSGVNQFCGPQIVKTANNEVSDYLFGAYALHKMNKLQVRMCLLAAIPKQLSVENVSTTLETAFELNLSDTKKEALQFIWTNAEEVTMSPIGTC